MEVFYTNYGQGKNKNWRVFRAKVSTGNNCMTSKEDMIEGLTEKQSIKICDELNLALSIGAKEATKNIMKNIRKICK